MEPQSAIFTLHGRTLRLIGDHAIYLDSIDGSDHSDNPLIALVAGLPTPATILDVGANIGLTSIVMAARSPHDQIIAFEPIPDNLDFLRHNLATNHITNCRVIASAVGDTRGTVRMTSRGAWSLVRQTIPGAPPDPTAQVSTETVPLTTLDGFCAEHLPGQRIDLIKIDVEGFEPNVLAGAAHTIAQWQPTIFMEFNAWALVLQNYNPLIFAQALWPSFDITSKSGKTWETPERFTSDNMVRNQSIDDLILRPRPGHKFNPMPITFGPHGTAAQTQLAALHNSTSWRITAPLRVLKQRIAGLTAAFEARKARRFGTSPRNSN
ncbi:MAG: FkbM family methyltransferase [Proteobacteria bacterium]|nr:FkbM family methyltransferase [Pseudomonadota bacterium]